MKKYIFIILAVMMVLSMAASVGASDFALYMRQPGSTLQKETLSGATAGYAGSGGGKLSTTITAGNRILGFSYSDSTAGALGLYDDSSATNANSGTLTNLIDEVYCSAGNTSTKMFPLPLTIVNGLVILKTGSAGVGMIYYE